MLLGLVCLAIPLTTLRAQIAGSNVNMVSGTDWTNGDPFLQRQNEPSIAVSTRNISHLLAGANDYRTVDLSGLLGIDERGDAWLGLFKSFDGGRTWQSTLLPGFPLDGSPQGLASPIHGFQAASDPTVRAGTNGLFYYTGIAYNRGTNPLSAVFISRFIDLNNKENGSATFESGSMTNLVPRDTIKYVDTTVVDKGLPRVFLDKPWVAVDIPRGNSTCTISVNEDGKTITQTIPAGAVYMTYTAFLSAGPFQFSAILFKRSSDCGATWSLPRILSRNDEIFVDAEHQGTVTAIDPSVPSTRPATIYVAWRRFASASDPDDPPAIFLAKSVDGGHSWSNPSPIVVFPKSCVQTPTGAGCPFDQVFTTASFRSNGYPAMTVDASGRVYLAWSQRDANGDGKIMIGVSPNGKYFPAGSIVQVDDGAVTDDNGKAFTTLSGRGSQLMPSLNFTAGKITLAYYDLRQDHTTGTFVPAPDPNCDPLVALPCALGAQYSETRSLEGELAPPNSYNNMAVFSPYITDSAPPLTVRRHTIDVMGAEAVPLAGWIAQVPSFKTFRVSRYEFGSIPQLFQDVEQIQFNTPNLPLFVDGTAPFMGDYIDLAGAPQIVPDGKGGWTFNTSPTANPVFHATWTDNRDVVPPADGNWKNYTPPISASNPGSQPSKFDPTQTPLACVVGQTGMRNQNVYTAEISQGVILTSPQTSKPVLTPSGQPIQREFVVEARNATNAARSFQISIPNQPATATASFQQFSLLTTQSVKINALSSQSFPVFVVAKPGSTVTFPSVLVTATENDGTTTPLTGSILLNSDPTNPALTSPDSALIGGSQIAINEFYNPGVASPGVASPGVASPGVANPGVANPGVASPGVANPEVIVALNPGVANPGVASPGVASPGVASPGLANEAVTDASYAITNEGNTSAAYTVQFFQSAPFPAGAKFQIILSKLYLTPQAIGCQLQQVANNVIVANVTNPAFVTDPAQLGNPGVASLGIQTPTLNLAPGESGQITIRTNLSPAQVENLVLPSLSPVVVSQAVNTVDVQAGNLTPPVNLIITTTSASLRVGVVTQPYSANLTAIGGNSGPRAWAVMFGSLPPGLQLNTQTGAITGTPTQTGSFSFTVQATDTGTPQHLATRDLTINVVAPLAIQTPPLPTAALGSQYIQFFAATGGLSPYSWSSTGTLPPGLTLSSSGTLSGMPTTLGTYSFSVTVSDSLGLFATTPYTILVANNLPQPAQILFLVQPSNAVGSEAISPAVQVQVFDATGAAIPNVQVAMSFRNQACPAATLSGLLTAATNASGIASFANLIIDRGQTNYTLAATVGNLSGISNAFNVEGFCDTGSMSTARHNHIVLGLPNGKVLITGGAVNPNSTGALASAELYDPAAHSFSTLPNMNAARVDHTMTLLPNGKVLIAGGFNDTTVISSAELFDPSTNSFTLLTAPMSSQRAQHTATLLANGKVLIAGGNTNVTTLATAEIFDPTANTFTPSAHVMNTVRQIQHADLLANGQVLISGGFDVNNNPLASAELYDPIADRFTPTGSMATARGNHASALLYNGKVLVAGGLAPSGTSLALSSTAEVYDPTSGTFSSTGSMSVPRGHYAGIPLDDGTIFISGGVALPGGTNADIYNPAGGTFRTTANFTSVQTGMRESILLDGTVLLASGVNSSSVVVPNSEVFYSLASPASITITPFVLPNGVQNQSYTQLFLQHGGVGNLTWTVASGSLPPGLSLSPGGILTGATTGSGTFVFTVNVVDSATPAKSATSSSFTLTVSAPVAPLVLAPLNLPTAVTGTGYIPSLVASGGTPPYGFAVTSGSLPAGITLGSNGTFSGSSLTIGTFLFGVTVTDSSPTPQTATQSFTIRVAASLAITTSTLPGGTANTPYSANISSTGGVAPVGFTVTAGSLPPGLSLAPAAAPPQTATLGGTPTTVGTFNFTITASDSSSPALTAPQSYSVIIVPGVVLPANVIFVTPLQNSVGGQVLSGSPVQVLVTDSTSAPIPSTTVTMKFNGAPPCAAATLGGTLIETTDATGTATFTNLSIDRGQFGYSLAATAGSVTANSNAFNVEGFCSSATPSATRFAATATSLQNGLVLLTGGVTAGAPTSVVATAELYDPVARTLTPTGSMNSARAFHTATLLNDGTVLITGGSATTINGSAFQLGPASSTAEIYNPLTGTFTLLTSAMNSVRALHAATLLLDGTVLLAGGSSGGTSGSNLSSAEIYDPLAQTFTASATGMTAARNALTATMLTNGQILLAGGYGASGSSNQSAEIYDSVAKTFTATSPMAFAHGQHIATLLPNGQVVLMGGDDATSTPTNKIELFDPLAGTFTASSAVLNPTARTTQSATLLPDGRVLVDAGFNSSGNILNSAEAFNFIAATSTPTGSMQSPRWYSTASLLPDGTVLIAGGSFSSGSLTTSPAEVFYPANNIPILITTLLPTGLLNVPYTQQLQEQGGVGKLTWTLTAGTLPTGLTLSSSGLLSGTPTVVGASIFTVQVTDSSTPAKTTTSNFVMVVVPQMSIIPTLPDAIPGVPYSQPILLAGGATPYTFTVTSGSLPSGLTLSTTGTVSGSTSTLGTFTFTVKVTDSSSPPVSATQAISLTVAAPLAIVTTTLPNGTAGVAYNASISTSGGSGTILFGITSSTLPPGLSLSPQGVLSGTPATPGTFTFTIAAVDSSAEPQLATQSYTVIIAPATLVIITTSPLAGATLSTPYSVNVTSGGGLQPYTWSVASGSVLPAGLNLISGTPSATISGTPTVTGTFQFTLNVTDSESPSPMSASISFLLTITATSASPTCPTTVNLTLCGSYVFGLRGFNSASGPTVFGGLFIADNSGHIVGGGEKQNDSVAGVVTNAFTGGSYVMDASGDGRGVLTLINANAGSSTFRFVLESAANAGAAQIEEFDASGTLAFGIIVGPETPPIAQIPANAIIALPLEGLNASGQRAAMLGNFQVGSSGCNGASGSFNSLAGEHIVTNTAGTVNTALTITGSCTAADPNTGHGTAQITFSGGTPFSNTTLNFDYFAVGSATAVQGVIFLETDLIAANQPILSGLGSPVAIPTGGYNAASPGCPCLFVGNATTNGSITTGHGVGTLARILTTPGTGASGTLAGVEDQNAGGTITLAGTWPYSAYTVDANGVGTVTGTGPTVHFVITGDTMKTLDESTGVATGSFRPQNAVNIASPNSPYIIGLGNADLIEWLRGTVLNLGVVTPSGATSGTLSGTVDVISTTGSNVGVAASGSYATLDSTTGRGTGTVNLNGGTGSVSVIIYAQRIRQFILLDVQSLDPFLIGARLQ